MELLGQVISAPQGRFATPPGTVTEDAERAARRTLRGQIARLERELADAFVTAYPMGGLEHPAQARGEPRLLDLGELEQLRDGLTERLHAARVTIAERADVYAANRVHLERMLLDPARYRFARVSRQDLGEPGCGVWEVRPRLGLIGMLMGWWQVKLSSGCPLAGGRGLAPAAPRASRPLGIRPRPNGRRASRPAASSLADMGRARVIRLRRANPKPATPQLSWARMRELLRTGAGAVLVVLIMFIGSLVLWIGTPVLWLWIGSQIQGATQSLGAALGTMFVGVIATIALLASLLGKLSNVYRANCRARGLADPGHFVLEGVLVVSAGFTLAAFVVWFFFFAGTSPVPVGIQL